MEEEERLGNGNKTEDTGEGGLKRIRRIASREHDFDSYLHARRGGFPSFALRHLCDPGRAIALRLRRYPIALRGRDQIFLEMGWLSCRVRLLVHICS